MTGLRDALVALPKVELHCHLEGTMRPRTLVELARQNGVRVPTFEPEELYHFVSLDDFLSLFWLGQSTLATRDDWSRLAYEAVLDGAAAGVVYREAFFTPARHLRAGQELDDIVAGLEEGLAAGEEETGARCRLVADMDRAFGPDAGLDLVERLVGLRSRGADGADRVIGVGMDSTELGIDPAAFRPAFEAAREGGLRLTAHQGENSPVSAIATCVEVLGVERVDHGVPVLDDPDLVARMRDERIPITVCPTSNVRIAHVVERLEDHVYPRMREAGLLATVNTDDPAFIDLDLATEYARVADAYGWGWAEMVGLALDAVDASWLGDDEKVRLRADVASVARQHDVSEGGGLRHRG